MEGVVKTVCTMCQQGCGIDVDVKNGKVMEIRGTLESPGSRGRLCVKALAAKDLQYDHNRLMHPMKREGETWRCISWDEALGIIAQKLKEVKEKYGAKALAVARGSIQEHEMDPYIKRFMNLYGTPNLGTNGDMCAHPRILVDRLTLGASSFRSPDLRNTRCMVLWGANTSATNPIVWDDMIDAKKRGAKLVVIDPRFTTTASKADLYVQIRPGTDSALALGMLNVIICEDLYDKEFVEKWTIGFDKLVEHVRSYPPDKVEEITSIPSMTISELARTYAKTKPAYLEPGNALDAQTNSFQTLRAIAILRAITGNIDVPGGNVVFPSVPLTDISLKERLPSDVKPLGADRYSLFTDMFGFVPSGVLTEVMSTGKPYSIKALIVDFSNLMLTWPNSKRTKDGLEKLELLVVMDLYMTKTAELAHIVLPAATFLEKTGIFTRSGLTQPGEPSCAITIKNKAVEPLGECWPDWKFWFELAKKMGFGDYFPWDDLEQSLDFQLKPTGITVDELKRNPNGIYYGDPISYRKYEEKGFRTPSGKVEIYCEKLKTLGYDPLPVFREPTEGPVSQTRLARKYPLILTTGGKMQAYSHSSYRGLSRLSAISPENLAEIHPKTAEELRIEDGEYVIIKTLRGSITLRAKLSDGIHPRVVSAPYGWAEANANDLTDNKLRDSITGSPELRSLLCRVEKST